MDGVYDTGVGNTITISNDNGYTFDWSSEWPVCCVIVKGGTGANIFRYGGSYGDAGLYAPFRPAGSPGTPTYGISHVTFGGLEPGTYRVVEALTEEQLELWFPVSPEDGVHDDVGLACGENIEDIDFLNARYGSITGYKYLDSNANGSPDSGDKPWDGSANPVTIELVRDGAVLREFVIDDDDGMYFFGDLEPGVYTAREALPLPAGMTSKASTSLTVLVTSGADVVVDSEGYFLNYLETEVAPEVITPPVTPQVQPEIVGQLPTTGADHMPLFLVAGMLVLLGAIALALGALRMRRA